MKTIKTFLPCFSGFYGTLFEYVIDSEVDYILEETALSYDEIEFDFKTFKEDIAKQCVGVFEDSFNREMGTNISVSFECVYSPREYNFGNDSIDVTIEISNEDYLTILEVIAGNEEVIKRELKERYSQVWSYVRYSL